MNQKILAYVHWDLSNDEHPDASWLRVQAGVVWTVEVVVVVVLVDVE